MTTATVEQTNKRSSRAKSQERLALALIAPALIVLTIVIVIPVIQSVKQALYGQPGLDPETGFVNDTEPFVGMKNFSDIFTGSGERFWTAFWNTTLFGVVTVVLETVLGVIMALIMHRAMAGVASSEPPFWFLGLSPPPSQPFCGAGSLTRMAWRMPSSARISCGPRATGRPSGRSSLPTFGRRLRTSVY